MASTLPSARKKTKAGAHTLLLLLALFTIAGAIAASSFIQSIRSTSNDPFAHITNYEECVAAGFPALKSYPGQCILPNGTRFIQEIPIDEQINSYTACVAAGNPIMESAPPQCRTRSGKTFTATPSEWPFPAQEFIPETACAADNECKLINAEQKYSCCYAGACEITDYSEEKWIAVNAEWFATQRTRYCPSAQECGPAPLCAVYVETSGYTAKCIQNTCQKALEGS